MRNVILCRYLYDPLDRHVGTLPMTEAGSHRFYCKSRLATEIQGAVKFSIFQHSEQILAQKQNSTEEMAATLLATDQKRSVLHAFCLEKTQPIVYSPYGHHSSNSGLLSLLGFNGEGKDPVTGYYFLGNGYRAFNPVLMRFNSPDSWSPFGNGGFNSYAYCLGDPVNQSDKSGHVSSAVVTGVKELAARHIRIAAIAKVQKTITKAIKTKTSSVISGNFNAKGFSAIPRKKMEIIAHNKRKAISEMLDESITLERALLQSGEIKPFTLTNSNVATKKFFDLQRSGIPLDAEGIPNPAFPITDVTPSGTTYLRTDFFDESISFFNHQASRQGPPEFIKTMEQSAGKTLLRRAKYIRKNAPNVHQ